MIRTRRSLLGYFLGAATLSCAGRQVSTSAPVTRPPAQQIPVDLDVVIRVDLEKIRHRLDLPGAEALARLLIAPARDPSALFVQAIGCTDRFWIGLRPDLDPRRWDSVVILEGDFSSITTKEIAAVWGPSLDLGGGYKRYDALEKQGRAAPSRLYTLHEERWLFASEAEVDALSRCLEEGRAERVDEPPRRGLVSVTARLGRVKELSGGHSFARAFESAERLDASLDLSDSSVKISARVRFRDDESASLAERALSLFAGIVLPKQIEWDMSRADRELSVDVAAPLELLKERRFEALLDGFARSSGMR